MINFAFFFIFTILKTFVPMIIHAKIQPNIPSVSREEVDFVIFVILVMAAILDIHPFYGEQKR